jgi:hypothetical protein
MTLPRQKYSPEAEERQELEAVLHSGIFKKAPNLQHFLEYVAEKHFAGTDEEIKEYSIAVQALHRAESFDPQADTIVRVTAHTLRKKLEQYYAAEGAGHPLRIQLPIGKYVLQFLRAPDVAADSPPVKFQPVLVPVSQEASAQPPEKKRGWWAYAIAALACSIILAGLISSRHRIFPAAASIPKPSLIVPPEKTQRIHFGGSRQPYMDAIGQTWAADGPCKGGTVFTHPGSEIQGTDDPKLFQEGREGRFHCVIPVAPGIYQLVLLFADTASDKVGVRQVAFSINDHAVEELDVVDEAVGNNVAVGKVYPGIHPMSDGAIHLDFLTEESFANAIEITPTASENVLPLRMLAGPQTVRDDAGNIWQPERFFVGGRRAFHAEPKVANSQLFEWERYGHFYYRIPVVPNQEYKVSLYFNEGWFGSGNGGTGGIGSRVFNVYCNGTKLLSDFDILKEQKNGSVVATSHHVKSTAQGTLELFFAPSKNYPLINAVEVEPEK